MHVTLVDPFFLEGDSPPNWPLGQVAATLAQDGHTFEVVDFCVGHKHIPTLEAFRVLEEELFEKVAKSAVKADVVYITTSLVVPQKPMPIFSRIRRLLTKLKSVNCAAQIFVGGAHINYLAVHCGSLLYDLYHDFGVSGFIPEQEHLFGDVINELSGKTDKTSSLVILNNGDSYSSIRRKTNSSHLKGYADWNGWDLSKYPEYRAVLTSMGCRYGCSFCFESKQSFTQFQFAPLLEWYLERGISHLAVEDSTIFGAHGLANVLNNFPKTRSLARFSAYALVNEIYKLSIAELRKLKAAGLYTLILGIETPDSETLKLYHKSVAEDRVRAVLDKLEEAEILAQGCVMLGIPEVTLDTTMYTIDYFLSLPVGVRRWHIFQPSFTSKVAGLATKNPLSLREFAGIEVNLPDHLLPVLFENGADEMFLEEHALVRALPYFDKPLNRMKEFQYQGGYSLFDLYSRMLESIPSTKESFNEEHYYRVLTPNSARGQRTIDRSFYSNATKMYGETPSMKLPDQSNECTPQSIARGA